MEVEEEYGDFMKVRFFLFVFLFYQNLKISVCLLGPTLQRGSGILGLLLRGASKVLPKLIGAGKTALKASAHGLKKAAMSDAGRSLARNLKDVAISSAADMAASAISGEDVGTALQSGVEEAKTEIASALKRKANQHRTSSNKKQKTVVESKKPQNTKSRKKKKKKSFNLFEQT